MTGILYTLAVAAAPYAMARYRSVTDMDDEMTAACDCQPSWLAAVTTCVDVA